MAVTTYPVNTAVSAAPVLIYTPSPVGHPNVYIQNMGLNTIYVGGAGVTVTGGIPLAPNQFLDFSYAPVALYAVSSYTPTAVTTTTATSAVSHGTSVAVTLTSGTGTVNGQYVVIGAGTSAETTTITSGGGTTSVTLAQLLDDHNVGAAFTVITPFASSVNVAAGTC